MRALIDAGAVDVAFQPIWDLSGTRVLGYEALARPRSDELSGPARRSRSPTRSAAATSSTRSAGARRCALAGELPTGALLFLNVSPQTLEHDALAGDSLVLAVRGAGYEPEQVVLEITERTDARKELLVPEAARLRALGFKLALDDVGAGNAGLEMLRALPVDFIKIDRAVVASAVEDRGARAVMLGIMAFARESGSFVIAEGIETEAMLELARDPDPDGEARADRRPGRAGLPARPAGARARARRRATTSTLATLSELTAARERRRIAAALQGGDELYRVLLRTVPDMVVALFDRDLRCQLVDGGMDTIEQWREILEGKTVRRGARATRTTASSWTRCCARCSTASPRDFEWVGRAQRLAPLRAGRAGARRSRGRDRRDGGLPRRHARGPRPTRRRAPRARAGRLARPVALSEAPGAVCGYAAGHGRRRDAPPVRLHGGGHDPQVAEVRRGRGQARRGARRDRDGQGQHDLRGRLRRRAQHRGQGGRHAAGRRDDRAARRRLRGERRRGRRGRGAEGRGVRRRGARGRAAEEEAARGGAEAEERAGRRGGDEEQPPATASRPRPPSPRPPRPQASSGNGDGDGRVKASPVAKRMAREMGVELGAARGQRARAGGS